MHSTDMDTTAASRSAWGAVLAMSLCVAVLIASEFMPVSLLTPIAADFRITEGQAGQAIAISGEIVVALVDDEVTIKELRLSASAAALMPRSSNKSHKPILARREMQVQGVVVASIPEMPD